MAIGVLIIGRSGSGKSASLRNFKKEELSIINVNGKPFPFKNDFDKVFKTDSSEMIQKALLRTKSKVVVIDDSQYIMANEFMRRSLEKGFDKYNLIAKNFWDIINTLPKMEDDQIVYFLHHEETDEFGNVKAKTQGKSIDSHIILEGCFTIVLRTCVNDGNYYFTTQTNGSDPVKSPIGMFSEKMVENDLKKVDSTIRAFYNFKLLD